MGQSFLHQSKICKTECEAIAIQSLHSSCLFLTICLAHKFLTHSEWHYSCPQHMALSEQHYCCPQHIWPSLNNTTAAPSIWPSLNDTTTAPTYGPLWMTLLLPQTYGPLWTTLQLPPAYDPLWTTLLLPPTYGPSIQMSLTIVHDFVHQSRKRLSETLHQSSLPTRSYQILPAESPLEAQNLWGWWVQHLILTYASLASLSCQHPSRHSRHSANRNYN